MTSLREARETVDRLDPARLEWLRGRSLLLTPEWSSDEIETLLDVAEAFQALDRAGVATPLFPERARPTRCSSTLDAHQVELGRGRGAAGHRSR